MGIRMGVSMSVSVNKNYIFLDVYIYIYIYIHICAEKQTGTVGKRKETNDKKRNRTRYLIFLEKV